MSRNMKPDKRNQAKQAVRRFIETMKVPIPGSMIIFRNPWKDPLDWDLYLGGEIAFSPPNGTIAVYELGGQKTGMVRVTLTIGREVWKDNCSPNQIERTANRFFRAWEAKNPHRYNGRDDVISK